MDKFIVVLGTRYYIKFRDFSEDPKFERDNIDGYCDCVNKEIIVCNMLSRNDTWKDESTNTCNLYEQSVLRHEIIHAFLFESGLADSSAPTTGGWAVCEEMIDWFAIQGPKIFSAWKELNVLL